MIHPTDPDEKGTYLTAIIKLNNHPEENKNLVAPTVDTTTPPKGGSSIHREPGLYWEILGCREGLSMWEEDRKEFETR